LYLDGKLIFERSAQTQPISIKTVALEGGRAYAVRFDYVHADHHARIGFGVRRADQIVDPAARRWRRALTWRSCWPATIPPRAEGYDRTFQLPLGQDDLINAVRAANKNTVVAITSGGGVDMTKWIDRVPALVQTWYPGQEGGTALAQLLVGAFSPSGKLPATFERRLEDNPTFHNYYPQKPKPDMKVAYNEGVFLGYRHYDNAGTRPLFPFGHGLSYTTFKLANLRVSPDAIDGGGGDGGGGGASDNGGASSSGGDALVTVSFDVTNTGARPGAEVAQVYVGDHHAPVPRPLKELKGFRQADAQAGRDPARAGAAQPARLLVFRRRRPALGGGARRLRHPGRDVVATRSTCAARSRCADGHRRRSSRSSPRWSIEMPTSSTGFPVRPTSR